MEDLSVGFYLGFIVFVIARLLILIACIFLVSRYKSTATYLMLGGIILSILFSMGGQLSHILMNYNDPEKIVQAQGVITLLNGLAEVILGAGILLFVIQIIKKKQISN
ncbi:hypothetical protein [Ulvibacter antarcticus]|uniref:MotA/TolQ/ExbB proton channel family protein n=1 Tax=Ulvibacter antarcticus TaxID=442714 RepID=A0A3L9YYL5_9FLAO|nr:hypothetical protein [Ulvibacter antarcticus]RMA64930.1 hypothetical protein BXY75_1815 [Ulvibacter antarcticus]